MYVYDNLVVHGPCGNARFVNQCPKYTGELDSYADLGVSVNSSSIIPRILIADKGWAGFRVRLWVNVRWPMESEGGISMAPYSRVPARSRHISP